MSGAAAAAAAALRDALKGANGGGAVGAVASSGKLAVLSALLERVFASGGRAVSPGACHWAGSACRGWRGPPVMAPPAGAARAGNIPTTGRARLPQVVVSTSTAMLDLIDAMLCQPNGCARPAGCGGQPAEPGHAPAVSITAARAPAPMPAPCRSWDSVRIDGGTSVEERQGVVDRFNRFGRGRVFLLSTRAGGAGLNLVGANHLVLVDSDWNVRWPGGPRGARARSLRAQLPVLRCAQAGSARLQGCRRSLGRVAPALAPRVSRRWTSRRWRASGATARPSPALCTGC